MSLPSERRYDLDWLRVLAVLLLVPFHAALIFVLDPNSIMYIKDVVNSPVLDEAAGFVHMWHMPLLFLISGSATYFALGFRSAGQYLRERFLRLLVPFTFGVLTFIPFTTYIRWMGTVSFWDHYAGFFRFDLEALDGYYGTFTPAHLWFILFLLVFSVVALPLFLALRTEKGQGAIQALGARAPASLMLWGVPLALAASLNLLGDKNPLYYFLIFLYGYVLAGDARFQGAIDRLTWVALAYGMFEAVFRVVVPQWKHAEWTVQWMALGLMYELGRWSLTLAMLGLGHRFLNRTNRFLRYAGEAAMPFYLLHMTFSVLAGYAVIQLDAPVVVKYPLIVLSATGMTLVAYELVRRWNITRWLFGMKPRKRAARIPALAKLGSGFLALLFVLAPFAAPSSVSAGQTPAGELDCAALDAYIEGQMAKHGIQGISLAVTSGTEIVCLKGYGMAGAGRPMTPQTPMYIGSQSKSFTGLAVAQLVEQGKIKLSDPVQKYIPWFRVADEAASKKMTVFHLLHHTSGLSEAGFTAVIPDGASPEDAVRALASARLTAPLGSTFQYFNYGYVVLSLVIEAAGGQPYEEYIQEHIFAPLEMTSTYTDPAPARENGLSQGYSRFFGFVLPQQQPHRAFEISEGFLISTAEDLAHYAIAMDNAGIYKGNQLLSLAGMDMLFYSVQGYAMGWFVENGHIFHGGANETFKTYVDIYPLRDQSIVLLINQGYMLDHYISAPQIFSGVEAIVLGNPAVPVSDGWSVRYTGWGLLAFVTFLSVYQARNLFSLRNWRNQALQWSSGRKVWDVALSFLIPTLILVAVFSGIKAYFGYRFNLTYQMLHMGSTLGDVTILMLVGSVPDYLQGFVKLFWALRGNPRV